ALGLCPPSVNSETYVSLLVNKANCLVSLTQYDSALTYIDSAIVESKRYKLYNKLAYSVANRSYGYLRAEEPEKALDLLQQEAPVLLQDHSLNIRAKAGL